MSENFKFHIVVVVCHPDDEALWVGGLISGLSQFTAICVDVICLSGSDADSPREQEFFRAKLHGGYHRGVVLGGRLGPATEPLLVISTTVEVGLGRLGLDASQISLLITHSPYGDEHTHPHHTQASKELYAWSAQQNIPFGYFNCLPLPTIFLQPLLTNMKRLGALHLLNLSRCKVSPMHKIFCHFTDTSYYVPKYYLQFLTDGITKRAMLNCYPSTDLRLFENGYAMYTSNCESIYLFSDQGMKPFQYLIDQMEVPGEMNLFRDVPNVPNLRNYLYRLASKIRRVACKALGGRT